MNREFQADRCPPLWIRPVPAEQAWQTPCSQLVLRRPDRAVGSTAGHRSRKVGAPKSFLTGGKPLQPLKKPCGASRSPKTVVLLIKPADALQGASAWDKFGDKSGTSLCLSTGWRVSAKLLMKVEQLERRAAHILQACPSLWK